MTLDNGTTLGEFRIVGGIGGGEFCEVYKAVRIDDPTAFAALKVHLPNEKTTARDFCREIENARLVHRIIPDGSPEIYAADTASERPWFAMTLGEPLLGTYPLDSALAWILRLIDLCIKLRDSGYLLGDIKVDNLCLIGGELCVIDFTALIPVPLAAFGEIETGSPYFTADEVTFEKDFGEVAVVHSIAVTFAALVRRELPEPYARPCARGYVPFPERRYQTFEELRDAIVRAPARDRRRIWLGAGVWKTRIAFKWTARTITAAFAVFWTIMTALYLCRRAQARQDAGIERAAGIDLGTANACNHLGDHSNEVACLWRVAKSASTNSPVAYRILANRYRDGLGVKADLEMSRRCAARAAPLP